MRTSKSRNRRNGMSEKLGQVSFDRDSQPLFLQQGMGRAAAEYSEEIAREIDAEVREIIGKL